MSYTISWDIILSDDELDDNRKAKSLKTMPY